LDYPGFKRVKLFQMLCQITNNTMLTLAKQGVDSVNPVDQLSARLENI